MFDEYARKLEQLEADVPKIFKNVAKRGAIHVRNEAVKNTDKEKLVDTGAYKSNWNAEMIEPMKELYGIVLTNSMDYASHLEYGHKLRNGKRWKGRFVGHTSMNDLEGWALLELREEIDVAMLQKKYGLSRSEAKSYLK